MSLLLYYDKTKSNMVYVLKTVLPHQTNHRHRGGKRFVMTSCSALQTSMTR